MMDIIKRVPINKIAARVTEEGEHYTPPKKGNGVDRETPYPVVKIIDCVNPTQAQAIINMVGKRRGRLVVIGRLDHVYYKQRWVCRCDCGMYTLRSTKAMKNTAHVDMCEQCQHLLYLKRNDIWRRTGKEPTPNDVADYTPE
ncbi:hypothetical protein QJS83_14960 [Bdellovibrio sp. 22V]|uniref:hypothetical protein n=1 Tax=Bdellovibrio sp. 22V TaxID=3044166 RepID=UPI002543463D|nr:hypothetical protein [Bdellovibrio sp. 22V]WII71763.1 hypothetical protein QJS83_14960 [Bdellovibrio sp. 22V]